jgi:hypothetical protein
VLAAPVIWPWYLTWLLPLAWLLPQWPRLATIALSVVLLPVLSVAERAAAPAGYQFSISVTVVFIAPLLTILLVLVLIDLIRRIRAGTRLEAERETRPGVGRPDFVAASLGPS